MRYMKRLAGCLTLGIALANSGASAAAESPAGPTPVATVDAKSGFNPPYSERTNPFQLPDSKAALATRREAVVQQVDLRLKGFVNVGGTVRAVMAIDGEVTALAVGDRRGDIEVLEVAPPSLTLQRGRHRWTESLLDVRAGKAK